MAVLQAVVEPVPEQAAVLPVPDEEAAPAQPANVVICISYEYYDIYKNYLFLSAAYLQRLSWWATNACMCAMWSPMRVRAMCRTNSATEPETLPHMSATYSIIN